MPPERRRPVYTLDSSALSGICKTAKQLYAAQSITDIDVDDVTKMVVQTANGGTLSFAQNDSTWTLTDDAEYNLNQDIVKKMASTICDLKTKWSVTDRRPMPCMVWIPPMPSLP